MSLFACTPGGVERDDDIAVETGAAELAIDPDDDRAAAQFTSSVAVEERHVVNPDATARTIVQALPLPEGPTHEGFSNGSYELGGTSNGYGYGSGCSVGCRGKRIPQIRQGRHTVTGSLDKDIVRRIVRAHITEVRSCYNVALIEDPTIAGRVTIELAISHSGKVDRTVVHDNDTGDATLGTCIAKRAEGWTFPKIQSGAEVVVTYPFILSPG